MKCVLVVDGVVANIAIYKACPAGWIKSDAGIGWAYDGSKFIAHESNIVEPLTVDEQIEALESSVTDRWLRGAALGDEYAIGKIQEVEDKIAAFGVRIV